MRAKFKKTALNGTIILVAIITIIGLSDLMFLSGSKPNQDQSASQIVNEPVMEKVFFKTSDNKQITADYFRVDKSKYQEPNGWLVLAHMMPATKESWNALAKTFQDLGYESLAVDLRGHGESEGGPDGFLNFPDSEHQKSIYDLEAAVEFLRVQGAKTEKISFIGASIGANLSLQYIANPPAGGQEFSAAVLLSPGFNYRGIKTEPMVKKLKSGQKVFFISSVDDGVNSVEVSQLFSEAPQGVKKEIKIYEFGGHGTDILKNQPELETLIINFIK